MEPEREAENCRQLSDQTGDAIMAAMKIVRAPGATEKPTCMCGEEMRLTKIEPYPAAEDAELRRYDCGACDHEMRVMVWKDI
jgi:hypothetical protein